MPDTAPYDAERRHTTPVIRRRAAVVALVTLASVAAGWLIGPQRNDLGSARSGDAALAARVTATLTGTDGVRALAVAEVTRDTVTWAGLGNATTGREPGAAPTASSRFELGSITKTFTGALLAMAIERGEVRAEDALAARVPELVGTPAGGVTLGALAQHSSGLPRLGHTANGAALVAALTNANPYASTTTQRLLEDASRATVDAEQPPTYSNFGVALLGTALTRAADAPDYATLLAERLTGPLGMVNTSVAASADDVPRDAVPGFHANGRLAPRWEGEGYLPAGSATFTTLADQAAWAQNQLRGGIGADALTPTADLGADRIGWGWISSVEELDGRARTLVWHNGGTAGFSTMTALDLDAGRAVVVLANTTTRVDDLAVAQLFDQPGPVSTDAGPAVGWVIVVIAAGLGIAALTSAWRAAVSLQAVSSLLSAAFGLLMAWHTGPWAQVGGWLWGLLLAPAALAGVILVARWRERPILTRETRLRALPELVLSAALLGVQSGSCDRRAGRRPHRACPDPERVEHGNALRGGPTPSPQWSRGRAVAG
jgi:CubicO group peptidase (beta-lactamase class C family)